MRDDDAPRPGTAPIPGSSWLAGAPGDPEVALPDEHREHVRVLLARGRRVNAIRLYRDLTGACLADASAAVDRLT
ncbi:hypothetical protein Bcav_1720 [Beutenbergia cavernae DSM 12333]|uniref:Uncharacterized protein n=1 Tax=Beutenbergia cavernae (strain ATCC BAA-8 / DSM 12333 / CCUG 43141 / JCM 11478 / NBRC 16432 / NCIMB 13614 / HKI 0122) TaxID=471853 RepID=C5C463_BEUC1|nr:hypothetical protein [Beutenbergia cavernae]ACQ79976.1 hypothetical protein Bcav_1720 [Beutenbergia cavernae DSM 12333]